MGSAASAQRSSTIRFFVALRYISAVVDGAQHELFRLTRKEMVASRTQIPPMAPTSAQRNPAYGKSGSSSSVRAEEDAPFDDGKLADSDDTARCAVGKRNEQRQRGDEPAVCPFASPRQAHLSSLLNEIGISCPPFPQGRPRPMRRPGASSDPGPQTGRRRRARAGARPHPGSCARCTVLSAFLLQSLRC